MLIRKDLIAARDDIAEKLLQFSKELRAGMVINPGKLLAMQALATCHDVFARQLDQSFFEPVNTMHELAVIDAIRLLRLWNAGSFNPPTEVAQAIERLERILPKQQEQAAASSIIDGR